MFTMIAHPQPKMPQPGNAWGNTAVSTAHSILQQYAPISLGEMADVALQNRTDTKYLMHTHTLLAALSQLQNEYRVLAVTGTRLNHYQTLYFDTADFDLYQRHHAGALNRYKVRSRVYLESELAFFEVKHKTNKKRTVKSRLQTDDFMTKMNGETAVFLQKHYPYEPGALLPVLGNSFTRITLVSRHRPERLTLDFDGPRFRRVVREMGKVVAIGLFAQVTSELGSNYIVQSFMTVVVGGVGNIWGTLAGAGMIGSLQKVIEFFNPSNTLAAQTFMIIFMIIFIQLRPKGIIALKGRAAGD